LHQDGNKLNGSYEYSDGKVYGQLSSNVWKGIWTQRRSGKRCSISKYGSHYWGRFNLIFDTNDSFFGKWGYCDDEYGGTWPGKRRE